MEVAASPGVPVRASDRRLGPARAGRAPVAPEQKECPAGEGQPPHGGLFPPLLQRWRWRREGALVCHQGSTEQVNLLKITHRGAFSAFILACPLFLCLLVIDCDISDP